MTSTRRPVNISPPARVGTCQVYSMVLMAELAWTMLPIPRELIRHRKLYSTPIPLSPSPLSMYIKGPHM